MFERLFALETFGIKLGLETMAALCEALGHPERQFVGLHIAGTNGKGSVAAMIHAALVAAGIKSARYTSPHLSELNERFVIGPAPVESEELEAVVGDVFDCVDRLHAGGTLSVDPTFFEVTTVVAFELFRRAGVDVAVIEVGLGGRLDATNVLPAPIGAITSIGFDHQQHLGTTIESIAIEKAGIIKPDTVIVTGKLPEAASTTITRIARERGATRIDATRSHVDTSFADGRAVVVIDTAFDRYGPMTLGLRGHHQVDNALVAVAVLESARGVGLFVPGDAIERGLSTAEWPARLEVIPVGQKQVILDAAHNVDGARALADHLERWYPSRPPLVVGVMRDKDADGILSALLPVTSTVLATTARSSRAFSPDELARRVLEIDPARHVRTNADPLSAIDEALREADVVCVTGSLILAGSVRQGLKARAILR